MRLTTMDDDDGDLWGPPLALEDDSFRNQTMRGCEFWFDCRTDVIEENFQNEKYCELVWRILSEKKQVVEVDEVDKDSVSIQNDMVSSGSGGDSHDVVGSSDSDKTLSAILPDADTSSAKSALDEDENSSSISDAQTIETRDSSNHTQEIELETRLKPQETASNGLITIEVAFAEDVDTSSSPVLASKVEEAEEHSCSSLVTDQVLDPIKQNKSSSAISRENTGGSTLRPLLLETREKVREKANAATNKDGEILKDHQLNDGLHDIVIASEPFTTESLLDLCDEPHKGGETPCDERSEKTHLEALKTVVVKDELIINLLTEARQKTESKALLNPGSALVKKRQRDNKGMDTNFIRNTKQKVQGEAGEVNIDSVKKSALSEPEIIRGSSVPSQHADSLDSMDGISQRGGGIVSDSVKSYSTSELKNKTGKELRCIAKELKVTHYYKLKKEDLLQRLTMHLNPS